MKLLVSIFLGFASMQAYASGCGWYTRYAAGPLIQSYETVGKFECDGFECYFVEIDATTGERIKYRKEFDRPNQPVPTNREYRATIEVREGMSWLDCDGSDTPPPFQKDGILKVMTHEGEEYKNYKGPSFRKSL